MGSVKCRGRSRHTMSAVVCGLDVHKDSTYAAILDSEGRAVDQTRMENERIRLTCHSSRLEGLLWNLPLRLHYFIAN